MIGKKLPAWKLPYVSSEDSGTIASKDLKGEPYVLYAYPKDMTPGCTTEACDFRDNIARLSSAGVKVFGISGDSIARHEKFIAKHDLPFALLSDEDFAICTKLGIYQEKKMYGKTFMGIVRSTFLIDADGKVAAHWPKVKVKGHVDEVLAAIDEL